MSNLNTQHAIYSICTDAFFDEVEHSIKLRIHKLNENYNGSTKQLKSNPDDKLLRDYNVKVKEEKEVAKLELKAQLDKHTGIRYLRDDALTLSKVIYVFDSTLTRTIGFVPQEMKLPLGEDRKDEHKVKTFLEQVNTDIIIVQQFHESPFKDVIINGFMYQDELYVQYTSSTGQIRGKKSVFIRQKVLDIHYNTLMCGLTIDRINEKGGMSSSNKLLSYKALSNSATEKWNNFNIDRVIVVEDLSTDIFCEVDVMDVTSFTPKREKRNIRITHTDGCGMILPGASGARMLRMPGVKGLLAPFNFREWAKIHGDSVVVKDIYGKSHNIVKKKIEIILTRSQFKFAKYYSSWEEYQVAFKLYNCEAAYCNKEEKYPRDEKLNYQMLQSLTDVSEEELKVLAKTTIDNINKIGSDKLTMLNLLDVTESNVNKSYLQQALTIYPELLSDEHTKEIIKDAKKATVISAKAGKLSVGNAKYTYLIPDLIAFCQFLFTKNKPITGVLANGQVYCSLYKDGDKLDVLRSPHNFREHPIRINHINEEKAKWFKHTAGVFTSIHDPISRVLQHDCDGDKALLVCSDTLTRVAERNNTNDDIVPLYYDMEDKSNKATDTDTNKLHITQEKIYEGLKAAFSANIGIISTDISKIWNSEKPDLDAIRFKCMLSNFEIDYAKTLHRPTVSPEIKKNVETEYIRKTSTFFQICEE
jgi:hypothetical protein